MMGPDTWVPDRKVLTAFGMHDQSVFHIRDNILRNHSLVDRILNNMAYYVTSV